jgi:hypothetical protein
MPPAPGQPESPQGYSSAPGRFGSSAGYSTAPGQAESPQSRPTSPAPGQPGYPNQPTSGQPAAPSGYYPDQPTSGQPAPPSPSYLNQPTSGQPAPPSPSYPNEPTSGQPAPPSGYYPDQPTSGQPAPQSPSYPNEPISGQPAPEHTTPTSPAPTQPSTAYGPDQRTSESEETSRLGYGQPGVETRWNPTTGPLPRRIPAPSADEQGDQPEIIDGEIVETEIVEREPAYSPRRAEPPVDAEVIPEPDKSKPSSIAPANSVEESLRDAAEAGSTDRFLSTLLLARVLIPGWDGDEPLDAAAWATNDLPDGLHLIVFTSHERMAEHLGADVQGSWIKFTKLIRSWPGPSIAFAVNPESQIGATLPGDEVVQLASWAAESGLGADDPEEAVAASTAEEAAPRPTFEPQTQTGPIMMQKPITPEQLSYYLERGYDRVSGFVHRAGEVAHLKLPEQLYLALGLNYAGSSFDPHATEAYVLRWRAYRANLYRIPYGGQHEAGMRAMEGWVIERPPFRGNGFAPSETNDVIAEFKVDSARLPHNAQIWRLHGEGEEELIAVLDADGPRWRPAGES